MNRSNLVAQGMLALAVSIFMVACGAGEDSETRAALERESLERELALALQPDSTQQPELNDVPLEVEEETPTPPVSAPAPEPERRPNPPVERTPPPVERTPPPQPAPAPAPSRPRVVRHPVPAGTTFGVSLNQQLSTSDNPVGSTFTATLSEAIRAPDGTMLIPAGATVQGRVVESVESGRAGEEASLAIDFTSISAGGKTYSIDGTALDTPVRLVTRDTRTKQAAKIGGGAAVGALLGQIIGRNTKSTVAGAAIGAAAGTAVAMGTDDVDAVVDEGANVTIRLDQEIRVDRETT